MQNNRLFSSLFISLIAYISVIPYYYLPYLRCCNIQLPLFKYLPLVFAFIISLLSYSKIKLGIRDVLKDRFSLLVLIYFLTTLISGIATSYYKISLMKAVYYGLTGVLFYFVLLSQRLEKRNIEFFLKSFIFISIVICIYGFITFIAGKDILFAGLDFVRSNVLHPHMFLKSGRISSTFGNPHFLATFLACIYPFSIYFWLKSSDKRNNLIFMSTTITIFFALFLTFSMASYSFILLFSLYCLFNKDDNYLKIKRFMLLSIVFVALSLSLITSHFVSKTYSLNWKVPKKIYNINFEELANPEGFSYRWDSLKQSANFLQANRGLGLGIGRVGSRGGLNQENTHKITMDNFYCTSLIEYGFIPTVIFIAIFIMFFRRIYQKAENSKVKLLNIAFISSIASVLINMTVWDAFNHPTIRIMFWSILGMACLNSRDANPIT